MGRWVTIHRTSNKMRASDLIAPLCASALMVNALAFTIPTAQLNGMPHSQVKHSISLRPGFSAGVGNMQLRRSQVATFLKKDSQTEEKVSQSKIDLIMDSTSQMKTPMPSHSSDKTAFCHAGVCNFHEDEFDINFTSPMAMEEEAMAEGTNSPVAYIKKVFASMDTMNEATATWWILGVVAISGVNFGVVKQVSEVFDNPTLLTGRFLVAAACLGPWLFNAPKKVTSGGLESGAWLAAGYIAQAVSLAGGTPSSICSFFASLSCIVCPFIEQFLGVRLDRKAWVAAALAIAGAGVLELGGGTLPTQDDLIALLQPLFFGIYLIRTEDAMKNHPKEAMAITALQLAAVSGIAAVWGVAEGFHSGLMDQAHVTSWLQNFAAHPAESAELVYMGIGPSAMALAIETVVLAKLSSSKTALLFSTEPVWAAVFGASFLGESIGANVMVGGVLATTACLVRSISTKSMIRTYRTLEEKLTKKEA